MKAFSRRFIALAALSCAASFFLVTVPASGKISVSIDPKTGALDQEFKVSTSGLRPNASYLVTAVTSNDTVTDCAASGSFENAQVVANATVKASSKGKFNYSLTPGTALGENWCVGSYKGKLKDLAKSKIVATFSFKVSRSA